MSKNNLSGEKKVTIWVQLFLAYVIMIIIITVHTCYIVLNLEYILIKKFSSSELILSHILYIMSFLCSTVQMCFANLLSDDILYFNISCIIIGINIDNNNLELIISYNIVSYWSTKMTMSTKNQSLSMYFYNALLCQVKLIDTAKIDFPAGPPPKGLTIW